MITFLLAVCCIFVVGASMAASKNSYIPQREQAVNLLIEQAADTLKEKYRMQPIGSGVSMPGGRVKSLALEFQVLGPMSREEIRKILLSSVHDFLKMINADNAIKDSLDPCPFTIKNIDIGLYFVDKQGYELNDPYIGIASVNRGQIEYETLVEVYNERIKRTIPQEKETYRETYEEALNLLENPKKSDN